MFYSLRWAATAMSQGWTDGLKFLLGHFCSGLWPVHTQSYVLLTDEVYSDSKSSRLSFLDSIPQQLEIGIETMNVFSYVDSMC